MKGHPYTQSQFLPTTFIKSKPSQEDAGVQTVEPGEEVPTDGEWHTLYFLPGIHDIGLNYSIHSVNDAKLLYFRLRIRIFHIQIIEQELLHTRRCSGLWNYEQWTK